MFPVLVLVLQCQSSYMVSEMREKLSLDEDLFEPLLSPYFPGMMHEVTVVGREIVHLDEARSYVDAGGVPLVTLM